MWVDCCKGFCIVLVVYGHVAGGLEPAGIIKAGSVFTEFREWIYLFHMPCFFFLSGLFARKACGRPFLRFFQGRLKALAYPYVIWTVIMLAFQIAMARFVNNPPDLLRARRFLYEPYGYGLWFLYSLFLISVISYGPWHWRISTVPILLIGLVAFVAAAHNSLGFWPALNTAMTYSVFYVIGGCFPGIVSAPFTNARWGAMAAVGVGMFLLMTLCRSMPSDPAGLFKLVRTLLGVGGAVCIGIAFSRTVAGGFWSLLGTYSLEIYLAHPLWSTASRAVLSRCGIHVSTVFVVGGVLLGATGSLATAMLCKRLAFPYLFRWPTQRIGIRSAVEPLRSDAQRRSGSCVDVT